MRQFPYLTVVYGWQRSVVQVEEVLFAQAVMTTVHQNVRPPDAVLVSRSTPVRRVRQPRMRLGQRVQGVVPPPHVAWGGGPPLRGSGVQLMVLMRVLRMLCVLQTVEVCVGVRVKVDLLLGQVIGRREVRGLEVCRGRCVCEAGCAAERSCRGAPDARDGAKTGRVTADQVTPLLQEKKK